MWVGSGPWPPLVAANPWLWYDRIVGTCNTDNGTFLILFMILWNLMVWFPGSQGIRFTPIWNKHHFSQGLAPALHYSWTCTPSSWGMCNSAECHFWTSGPGVWWDMLPWTREQLGKPGCSTGKHRRRESKPVIPFHSIPPPHSGSYVLHPPIPPSNENPDSYFIRSYVFLLKFW